jgi:hypothetical protein
MSYFHHGFFLNFLHVSLLIWAIKKKELSKPSPLNSSRKKKNLNLKGKYVLNGEGHKGLRMSTSKKGDSHKKGCSCFFIVNNLYHELNIVEISFVMLKHVNNEGIIVHGNDRLGDLYTFVGHVLEKTKT